MATTVTHSDTRQPVLREQHISLSDAIEKEIGANAQYKLTALLQTTIEIEPLFELFFAQIQHLLKLNSCEFTNDIKQIQIKLGTVDKHTCDYSLNIQQQYLGNIRFSRKQRFSSDELAQLKLRCQNISYLRRQSF